MTLPQHSPLLLSVAELQRLENEAWASPARRALYATRHVLGFPWHTVQSAPSAAPCDNTGATFDTSVRRHVVPYDFAFTVFVKGRWVGRRLLEVYAEELPHHSAAYYEACLRRGRLYCLQRGALGRHNTQRRLLKRTSGAPPASGAATVDGNAASSLTILDTPQPLTAPTTGLRRESPDESTARCSGEAASPPPDAQNVVLKHGDVVYHTVHRHEVPVTVGVSGVDTVLMTAVRITRYGLICVNKPTGLPTHATGRYYYNSLTSLLEYVLAPKRLTAWLVNGDPLLQSLVSTALLSAEEKAELYAYYGGDASCTGTQHGDGSAALPHHEQLRDVDDVDPDKAPRPCHRLDKVTSGVLLLAVHQEAAKRIGAVLMRKAKEVEEAVTTALQPQRSCEDPQVQGAEGKQVIAPGSVHASSQSSIEEAGSRAAPASLQQVLSDSHDLQKYYLARVEAAPDVAGQTIVSAARSSTWAVAATDAFVTAHNAAVLSMLHEASGLLSLPDREPSLGADYSTGRSLLPPAFPSGVLCAVPVCTGGNSGAVAAAATLCQTVSSRPAAPGRKSAAAAAVVLCTPYTGRLHQIRVHLSSMGWPIVGDVVSASTLHARATLPATCITASGDEEKEEDTHTKAPGTASSLAHTRWARLMPGEDDYVYFDAEQLPTAYRTFTAEGELTESPGVKRPRAGEASLPTNTTPSAAAWHVEPLCYECAGRLPIVAAGECATGTSAICLHAWVYEVREDLLLRGGADASGDGEERHAVPPTAPSTRRCAVSEGGLVRFEAPPPMWALLL